jgi:AAA+ ATPase superfamily predicted ATPase
MYFKPLTLRAYARRIAPELDEDLKLWELSDDQRADPRVRHLLWLSLTLICGTPLVIVPLTGATINWLAQTGVPDVAFDWIPGMVVTFVWIIGSIIGFWLRWKRRRSLVNLAWWGIVIYVLTLLVSRFLPDSISNLFGEILQNAIAQLPGSPDTYVIFWYLAVGVAVGVAWTIAFLLFYFRLPFYLIELPWNLIVGRWAESAPPEEATRRFRLIPLYWDEFIWLPLWGLDHTLVEIGKKDRRLARTLIAEVAQSFRQGWAARNALIELTIYDLERVADVQTIASVAEQLTWLPLDIPAELETVLPPIREIAQYVQAALESDTLYNKQQQMRDAYERTQRVRAGLALHKDRRIAVQFGRILERWEAILSQKLGELKDRESIPNVYVAGNPLVTNSKVFKGRHDLFLALERELATAAEQRPALLLYGGRRCGKTSAIKQLPVRLGPRLIPVEVDMQDAVNAEGASGLLCNLAKQIRENALTHRRLKLPELTRDALAVDPYPTFGAWLSQVEAALGERWILLCLDEYERLQEMLEDGRIDRRIFGYLRHLIQHHPQITILLSGSHTLTDLPPLWSDYFINVRTLKIGHLKEDEARELIVRPKEDFPLIYDEDAVEHILKVTGCQPYLVQITCRDLVDILNEQNRTHATRADAEHAFASVLTTAARYFDELWRGRDTDDTQRAVMRAIALRQDVRRSGDAEAVNVALNRLVRRDILVKTANGYRFRVELVQRWIKQRVTEGGEIVGINVFNA